MTALAAVSLALTPLLPLLMALAVVPPRSREWVARLLPLAPLPALAAAFLVQSGGDLLLEPVLLGLDLGIDGPRRLLLVMTALLWMAAGLYGRGYIPRDAAQHRYNAFFLASMGGNLGLIVALDAPGFYLFFSLMTLCSYMLVVFERGERSYRAGRVYLVLSLIGEMALLWGLLRAVAAADSLMIDDMPVALAEGGALTPLLLFFGFAIKAGQFPLHVWLPLAHPAAPTPASAVLSGAMIKAGLLGLLLFLPLGEAAFAQPGLLMAALGMVTAFYGVLFGLPQRNPKTVLAYSSLSQMGVLISALGVVQASPQAAPLLLPAVVFYALHHGFSKGALFLSVGVVQQGRTGRLLALSVAAVAAVAIAGAPLTGGSLAKLLVKAGVEEAQGTAASLVAPLLSWSAVGTALLMLRFLAALAAEPRKQGEESKEPPGAGWIFWIPFAGTAALAQLFAWSLVLVEGAEVAEKAVTAYGLWESAWPLLLALVLAAVWLLAERRLNLPKPDVAEGDLIAWVPTLAQVRESGHRLYITLARPLRRRPQLVTATGQGLADVVQKWEQALVRPQGLPITLLLLSGLLLLVILAS
ncbi:complex I subunit 5 family protein [Aquibaculum arenosum]|uniref:Complex I subunit 5 family protein n=1 Tax=Aquibaculum arenosum TaxID=3032591 RepID=A0ABT5YHY0_9PROT|nr:complex I subunit 5 family protein [Fodinicurvata sp. CAU 1616]MDF2094543.1 complex I subunit 5 family protein [Fodinicurvata sp. CAU 1616]